MKKDIFPRNAVKQLVPSVFVLGRNLCISCCIQQPPFEGPQPSECFKLVLLGTKYNIGVDTHCVVFSNRISIVSH